MQWESETSIDNVGPITQEASNNKLAATTPNTLAFFVDPTLPEFVATADTTDVTLHGETSITMTFGTTRICNCL